MIGKLIFISTQSQFENSGYQPDVSLGLGYGDVIMFPTFKIGSTVLNTRTEIAPSAFNGGKVIINTVNKKANGIYDDVTLGTINQINNISPTIGNVLLDTRIVLPVIGTGEVINDYYNDSSPIPSTLFGTIFSGKKNLQDLINDENKMNDIKNWIGLENSKESNN